MSDQQQNNPGTQPSQDGLRTSLSALTEYEEVTFRIRKADRRVVMNTNLALIIENLNKAISEFAPRISNGILQKDAVTANFSFKELQYFLQETDDSLERLKEMVEDAFLLETNVVAKIRAKSGVPIKSEDLNKAIKESTEQIKEEKDRVAKRKSDKAKASKKKASKEVKKKVEKKTPKKAKK